MPCISNNSTPCRRKDQCMVSGSSLIPPTSLTRMVTNWRVIWSLWTVANVDTGNSMTGASSSKTTTTSRRAIWCDGPSPNTSTLRLASSPAHLLTAISTIAVIFFPPFSGSAQITGRFSSSSSVTVACQSPSRVTSAPFATCLSAASNSNRSPGCK